jgi:hypothetical protein
VFGKAAVLLQLLYLGSRFKGIFDSAVAAAISAADLAAVHCRVIRQALPHCCNLRQLQQQMLRQSEQRPRNYRLL